MSKVINFKIPTESYTTIPPINWDTVVQRLEKDLSNVTANFVFVCDESHLVIVTDDVAKVYDAINLGEHTHAFIDHHSKKHLAILYAGQLVYVLTNDQLKSFKGSKIYHFPDIAGDLEGFLQQHCFSINVLRRHIFALYKDLLKNKRFIRTVYK